MRYWRLLRPGRSLIRSGDAATGCALAAFHFAYLGADTLPVFAAVVLISLGLHAAGHLWDAAFDPGLRRGLVQRPGEPEVALANAPVFLGAAALTLAAWLLAMSQGPRVLYAAFAAGVIHIAHAAVLRRNALLGPLSAGLARGAHILTGLASFPLLHLAGFRPALAAAPVTLALYFAAADTPRTAPGARADRFGTWLALAGILATGAAVTLQLPTAAARFGPWEAWRTWAPGVLGTHLALILAAIACLTVLFGFLVAAARADAEGTARLRRAAAAGGVLLEAAVVAGASLDADWRVRAAFLVPLGTLYLVALRRAWRSRL